MSVVEVNKPKWQPSRKPTNPDSFLRGRVNRALIYEDDMVEDLLRQVGRWLPAGLRPNRTQALLCLMVEGEESVTFVPYETISFKRSEREQILDQACNVAQRLLNREVMVRHHHSPRNRQTFRSVNFLDTEAD